MIGQKSKAKYTIKNNIKYIEKNIKVKRTIKEEEMTNE